MKPRYSQICQMILLVNIMEMKTTTLRKITYFWDMPCFFSILSDFINSPSSYFKNAYKANVSYF